MTARTKFAAGAHKDLVAHKEDRVDLADLVVMVAPLHQDNMVHRQVVNIRAHLVRKDTPVHHRPTRRVVMDSSLVVTVNNQVATVNSQAAMGNSKVDTVNKLEVTGNSKVVTKAVTELRLLRRDTDMDCAGSRQLTIGSYGGMLALDH